MVDSRGEIAVDNRIGDPSSRELTLTQDVPLEFQDQEILSYTGAL